MLSWAMLLFCSVAIVEVKCLRYVCPLMPGLVLLGSRALFALLDWARQRDLRLATAVVAMISLLALTVTNHSTVEKATIRSLIPLRVRG